MDDINASNHEFIFCQIYIQPQAKIFYVSEILLKNKNYGRKGLHILISESKSEEKNM